MYIENKVISSLKQQIVVVPWNNIKKQISRKLVDYLLSRVRSGRKKIEYKLDLLIPNRIIMCEHPVFRKIFFIREGVWPKILYEIKKWLLNKIRTEGIGEEVHKILDVVQSKVMQLAANQKIKVLKKHIEENLEEELYSSITGSKLKELYEGTEFEKNTLDIIIKSLLSSLKNSRKGLRPFSMPGSIASDKVSNLYFGEEYDAKDLVMLAYYLISSVCIGQNIAIYLEGGEIENIIEEIKECILLGKFRAWHVTGELLKEFKIGSHEREKPFIVLSKFLIKILELYDEVLQENSAEANRIRKIINDLKESYGLLYVVPDFKGERTVITVPRLDNFISHWLEKPDRRKIIKNFLYTIYFFLNKVYSKAGTLKSKVDSAERILINYLELFLKTLIEHNILDWQSLRRIHDCLLELSITFDLPVNFGYVKQLEMICVAP